MSLPSLQRPSRRQVLIAGGLGAGLLLVKVRDRRLITGQRSGIAFGTTVSLTAAHGDRKVLDAALDAAWRQLAIVEAAASLFRGTSALCLLNRDGHLDQPPTVLVELLKVAVEIARITDGAFDPTVQPLWQLYAKAHAERREATAAEIATASVSVGWHNIEISAARIQVRSGSALTLNGVAQGYATDQCLRVLSEHGVQHAFVDTGELGALGRRADHQAWTAAIADPRQPGEFAAVASPLEGFLATSGDYATTWSSDFSHHHILDPRTHRSPTETASVSVIASTGAMADGLATAMMVLGPEASLALVRRLPCVEALILTKAGQRFVTPSFPLAAGI